MNPLNKEFYNEKITTLSTKFWREIGVKNDSILELDSLLVTKKIIMILKPFKNDDLKELCDLYGIGYKKEDTLLEKFLSVTLEERKLFLLLYDFSLRKKRTIINYYNNISIENKKFETTSLSRLIHLFELSPIHLIEIFVGFLFDNRSSGELYIFDNEISFNDARKVAEEKTFRDKLCDTLFIDTGSKNYYRIFSYSHYQKKVLVLIYKQVSDISKPDFISAPRNREVIPILFLLDSEKRTVEIKSSKLEEQAIIKYFIETFGNISKIKNQIFSEYKKEVFVKSILEGSSVNASGKFIDDFMIYKIKFRRSSLKNSPQITLELDHLDIWSSVEEAYANGTININSIKDLDSVYFKSSLGNRYIKSTVLNNGNVIFTMEDSNLSKFSKESIGNKFFEKFGVPLYTEISNEGFLEGKADKIDYLMGASKIENFSEFENLITEQLVEENIITKIKESYYYCETCQIDMLYDNNDDVPESCDKCENDEISIKNYNIINLNNDGCYSKIKQKVRENSTKWLIYRESKLKINSVELKCLHLRKENQEESLQIIIADKSLQRSILKQLNKMLKPTLLVLLRQNERYIDYNQYSCIEPINFGRMYLYEQEFSFLFDDVIKRISLRSKNYIATASSDSYKELTSINNKKIQEKKYTSSNFEDDIFSILKDLFPNSEKWGKELSGKAVPEGIFTISFIKNNKMNRRTFSYDCKFNTNDQGYDLSRSEQRKATEYVKTLNENDYIQSFSDKNELTAHIFISNKFKEANFSTMTKYFYEQLHEDYNTKAIFLELDKLIYLYEKYRENHADFNNARDLFYREIFEIFTSENITNEIIESKMVKALDKELREYSNLDTLKVTQEMKLLE